MGGKSEREQRKKEKKKEKKRETGLTILAGLSIDDYSQALSHYRQARDLLPAAFQPWAGAILIMQPGRSWTPPMRPY